MIRFPILLARVVAVAMLGSLLVLSGCRSGSTKDAVTAPQGKFDVVVKAYKSGQFLVDGAVLSAIDTGSHFAYLKDQHKLPKTVLLEASDESKVRKQHLQYMARMQMDYGFTVYYEDGGVLKKINPVDTKARKLEDYHAPAKMDDDQKCKSAAGCDNIDQQQQQQRRQY